MILLPQSAVVEIVRCSTRRVADASGRRQKHSLAKSSFDVAQDRLYGDWIRPAKAGYAKAGSAKAGFGCVPGFRSLRPKQLETAPTLAKSLCSDWILPAKAGAAKTGWGHLGQPIDFSKSGAG
jgi:hypothetical protein